jgi:ribosomal protein L31E
MPRQISIFAGSFKPPHKGHFEIVKKMLKLTKKPRKGDKGPGTVYVFISKKAREPCLDIDGEISKTVWHDYIKLLPEKEKMRVRLVLSGLSSPTQTAYGFVKRIASPGDIFYLVKSAKNAKNTRFSSFVNLKGKAQFKEMVLPGYESMYSTNMREAIKDNKKSDFYKFLPKEMTNMEKKKLWDKLSILC